jgi:arylsulfatase A
MSRFALFALALVVVSSRLECAGAAVQTPNVVLILCDNLGYGDVGAFGNTQHRTPNLDRMAREGRRFTHFYSASCVCSPSRAALMTGCYPLRVGLQSGGRATAVLMPIDPLGIADDEWTMAEMFRAQGYATKAIGKWHLGDQPPFLPTRHGFDAYLGIPYSENMVGDKKPGWPPLPLLRDETVIEAPVDRDTLMQRYTTEAVAFIHEHRERPFFLYFPTVTPGSDEQSFASSEFQGRSRNGRYGDAVEELDWSVGRILTAIREADLDDRTLVVWTSDNGAVQHEPRQGTNVPLAGWGYSTAEGGMRVPMIARWSGHVPGNGACDELTTMMDLLPTFADLIRAKLTTDRLLDGRNIGPLLRGELGAASPHAAFYYYQMDQLQAVRAGRWKRYLPLANYVKGASPERTAHPPALYDVVADPGETRDLAAEHPDVVAELQRQAQRARDDLGDRGRPGRNVRKPGYVAQPVPQKLP